MKQKRNRKWKAAMKTTCTALALAAAVICTAGCSNEDTGKAGGDEYTPTSSLVLTDQEAAALSGKVRTAAYFVTEKGDKLAGEFHLIEFTAKDKRTDRLLKKAIEELIAGPANSALQKTLPEGTEVNSVKITGGKAVIDFNQKFSDGLPSDKKLTELVVYSVVNTATEFKEITSVVITVDGKAIENTQSGFSFTAMTRNSALVTAIENASADPDYSEDVFLDVELE